MALPAPLAKHLSKTQQTAEQFAGIAGVHPATLYRLDDPDHGATATTLRKIIQASDGALTLNDLVPVKSPTRGKRAKVA